RDHNALDLILHEEAQEMISKFREGVWWAVPSERYLLWQRIYKLFVKRNESVVGGGGGGGHHDGVHYRSTRDLPAGTTASTTSAKQVFVDSGNYFVDLATEFEDELTLGEQALLIRYALEFFAGFGQQEKISAKTNASTSSTKSSSAPSDFSTNPRFISTLQACLLVVLHQESNQRYLAGHKGPSKQNYYTSNPGDDKKLLREPAIPLKDWLRDRATSASTATSNRTTTATNSKKRQHQAAFLKPY
ncbi:unnamed protein product, partial [Amoebophrya sp. A120]